MASFTSEQNNASIEDMAKTNQTQRSSFTAEDLFNYLYGYTPIRLVDPIQLYRERQRQVMKLNENGAKQGLSCKYSCIFVFIF